MESQTSPTPGAASWKLPPTSGGSEPTTIERQDAATQLRARLLKLIIANETRSGCPVDSSPSR